MADPAGAESPWEIPRIPASVGALIFDESGGLLILKPNYKRGWTIPGGQIEQTGESPWQGCRRETLEECGLQIERGRLACVDFLRPRPGRPGGVRFLFDCGPFGDEQLAAITIDGAEIDEHRFVELPEAAALLSGPVRRRVLAGAGRKHCVYLEGGAKRQGRARLTPIAENSILPGAPARLRRSFKTRSPWHRSPWHLDRLGPRDCGPRRHELPRSGPLDGRSRRD
jgi:8-oxo-dGTP diphosphatase